MNDIRPTHVVDWEHIFANGRNRGLRLYITKDQDGWQLIAVRKGDGGLLTRSEFEDVLESFDQNAAMNYPFGDEARPLTEKEAKEVTEL